MLQLEQTKVEKEEKYSNLAQIGKLLTDEKTYEEVANNAEKTVSCAGQKLTQTAESFKYNTDEAVRKEHPILSFANDCTNGALDHLAATGRAMPGEFKEFRKGLFEGNGAEIAVTTGLAIAGGVLLGPLGAAALCGLASGLFSFHRQQKTNTPTNWGKVVLDSAIGGVTGLFGGGLAKLGRSLISGAGRGLIIKTVSRTVVGGATGGFFAGTQSIGNSIYDNPNASASTIFSLASEKALTGVYYGAMGGGLSGLVKPGVLVSSASSVMTLGTGYYLYKNSQFAKASY